MGVYKPEALGPLDLFTWKACCVTELPSLDTKASIVAPIYDLLAFLRYSLDVLRMLNSELLAGFLFELNSTFHVQQQSASK